MFSSVVFVGAALGQITSGNGDVVFLHLPEHVSESDLPSLTPTVKDRLYGRATEWLRLHSAMADNDRLDRIIVFIDEQGRPILPDLEAARRCFSSRTFSSVQTNGNEL